MASKTRLVYLLITTFCLAGCGYKSRNPVSENGLSSADTIQTALAPRYAKGFKITVRPDGVKLLSISEPNNNHAIPELFALVPKGIEPFASAYSNSLSGCTFIALSFYESH